MNGGEVGALMEGGRGAGVEGGGLVGMYWPDPKDCMVHCRYMVRVGSTLSDLLFYEGENKTSDKPLGNCCTVLFPWPLE